MKVRRIYFSLFPGQAFDFARARCYHIPIHATESRLATVVFNEQDCRSRGQFVPRTSRWSMPRR